MGTTPGRYKTGLVAASLNADHFSHDALTSAMVHSTSHKFTTFLLTVRPWRVFVTLNAVSYSGTVIVERALKSVGFFAYEPFPRFVTMALNNP